jgi:hypothetical protein
MNILTEYCDHTIESRNIILAIQGAKGQNIQQRIRVGTASHVLDVFLSSVIIINQSPQRLNLHATIPINNQNTNNVIIIIMFSPNKHPLRILA